MRPANDRGHDQAAAGASIAIAGRMCSDFASGGPSRPKKDSLFRI
jgi:hypothetical protein